MRPLNVPVPLPPAALLRRGRIPPCAVSGGRSGQRGAAAVEFALGVLVLMLLCMMLVAAGALFWGQQKLAQLASDGGRMVLALHQQGMGATDEAAVCARLALMARHDPVLSGMGGGAASCSVRILPASPAAGRAQLTVALPVEAWPLLRSVLAAYDRAGGGGSGDVGFMRAEAVVRLPGGRRRPGLGRRPAGDRGSGR